MCPMEVCRGDGTYSILIYCIVLDCILFYSILHPFSKPLVICKVAEMLVPLLFYCILFYIHILLYSILYSSY